MNELLTKVLDAHGGLERWRSYDKVEATIVAGGGFFPLKGVLQDADPRRLTVWLHEERSSLTNFGAADQRTLQTRRGQACAAIGRLMDAFSLPEPVMKENFIGRSTSQNRMKRLTGRPSHADHSHG